MTKMKPTPPEMHEAPLGTPTILNPCLTELDFQAVMTLSSDFYIEKSNYFEFKLGGTWHLTIGEKGRITIDFSNLKHDGVDLPIARREVSLRLETFIEFIRIFDFDLPLWKDSYDPENYGFKNSLQATVRCGNDEDTWLCKPLTIVTEDILTSILVQWGGTPEMVRGQEPAHSAFHRNAMKKAKGLDPDKDKGGS